MPYGTTCDKRENCENKPHITGEYYLLKGKQQENKEGIGISQIANDGM